VLPSLWELSYDDAGHRSAVSTATATASRAGQLTLISFIVVVLLGGSNFVAVRFSNQELDPFWGAGLRFSLAAALFVLFVVLRRLRWPRGRQLWMTAGYGIVTFTLSYALMYWALVEVTAGIAAVVLAMVPLLTPFLAAAHKLERLSGRALIGATIAFAGVVWMTIGPDGLVLPLSGLIAILLAAISVAEGVVLSKTVAFNHPAVTNAVAMSFGSVLMLAVSAVAGETWQIPQETDSLVAVIYLVLFGSIALFVLSLLVVRTWAASAMAYAFVLFPVVALLLEAWLADVPLTAKIMVGAILVMTGVWIGALRGSLRRVVSSE
jgi:drug/metabolite transporter (DMT)-like permease